MLHKIVGQHFSIQQKKNHWGCVFTHWTKGSSRWKKMQNTNCQGSVNPFEKLSCICYLSLPTPAPSKIMTFPSGGRSESQTCLSRSRVATEKSRRRSSDYKDRASDRESEPGKGRRRCRGAKGQANSTIQSAELYLAQNKPLQVNNFEQLPLQGA